MHAIKYSSVHPAKEFLDCILIEDKPWAILSMLSSHLILHAQLYDNIYIAHLQWFSVRLDYIATIKCWNSADFI